MTWKTAHGNSVKVANSRENRRPGNTDSECSAENRQSYKVYIEYIHKKYCHYLSLYYKLTHYKYIANTLLLPFKMPLKG